MRMAKRALAVLVGLFAAYALLLWGEWLPPVPAENRQALALMRQAPERATGERNAFARLWLIQQDVPEAEIESVAEADWAAYRAQEASGPVPDFRAPSTETHPPQRIEPDQFCPRAPAPCLALVRADPERARRNLDQHRGFLQRALGLRETDHARYPLQASWYSPIPPLQHLGPVMAMDAALRFVDGDVDAALSDVCSNLSTWRRLRSRTNMLIVDMVGIAFAANQAVLLAEMLAELPAEHPLPASCDQALAPQGAEEFDQCDTWRGEFALSERFLAEPEAWTVAQIMGREQDWRDRFAPLLVNGRSTVASVARDFARLCPAMAELAPHEPGLLDRVFNPGGVWLWQVGRTNFAHYGRRADDFATLLQALRTVVWLRGKSDAVAAFQERPTILATPRHLIEIDVDAAELRWSPLEPRQDEPPQWRLPLAASR